MFFMCPLSCCKKDKELAGRSNLSLHTLPRTLVMHPSGIWTGGFHFNGAFWGHEKAGRLGQVCGRCWLLRIRRLPSVKGIHVSTCALWPTIVPLAFKGCTCWKPTAFSDRSREPIWTLSQFAPGSFASWSSFSVGRTWNWEEVRRDKSQRKNDNGHFPLFVFELQLHYTGCWPKWGLPKVYNLLFVKNCASGGRRPSAYGHPSNRRLSMGKWLDWPARLLGTWWYV